MTPEPRIALGGYLREKVRATSAMDLSDGLSLDLHRLCLESGLSAVIVAPPVFRGASVEQALHGGEDYELLFTAPASAKIPRRLGGIAVTRIGRILPKQSRKPRLMLVKLNGRRTPLPAQGWEYRF